MDRKGKDTNRILIKVKRFFDGFNLNAGGKEKYILVSGKNVLNVQDDRPMGSFSDEIDLSDLFVMPGLVDLHVHLTFGGEGNHLQNALETSDYQTLKAYKNAQLAMQSGFLTLRDVGASGYQIVALRDAINDGILDGPRIFAAGKILTETGGHGDSIFTRGEVCDGVDEVRKAVRTQVKNRVDLIKMTCSGGGLSPQDSPHDPQFTVDEIKAAVEEAHSKRRRVAVHAQSNRGIKNSIVAGVDTVEHALYLDEEACRMLIANDKIIVPTMVSPAMTAKYGPEHGTPEWAIAKVNEALEYHGKSISLAHRMGVKIAFGTDAGTPFNYHGKNAQEFLFLTNQGELSSKEALYAATGLAGEALGMKGLVGALIPSSHSDLIAIDGDPISSIDLMTDPSKISFIMMYGKIVKSKVYR